ncbi:hypothetical protein BH09PSE4_BH09PSE4_00160 [soil metagenome]
MSRPRLLALLFWAAFLFTFVMATLPHPPPVPGTPPDKVQHILAFVVLTILAAAAFPAMRWLRIAWLLPAFGALIEIVQAIPALHRDSDVMDFLADSAAVLVTLGIVALLHRFRTSKARA